MVMTKEKLSKLPTKHRAILTIDFEDYRNHRLRDHGQPEAPDFPEEIERQLDILLDLFDSCNAHATFLAVGRLCSALHSSSWHKIIHKHSLGCHGYEHLRVSDQGAKKFQEDVFKAKSVLEDASGQEVVSYRAPYFSNDMCDPWFGEILAEVGFKISSSKRMQSLPSGSRGTFPLAGTNGSVIEVPLRSIGLGPKRLTIIGGTYFRLLPLGAIKSLLRHSEQKNFIPIIYLHNYDIDPLASPIEYPANVPWVQHAADKMRQIGRDTAGQKLKALAQEYEFHPLESVLAHQEGAWMCTF